MDISIVTILSCRPINIVEDTGLHEYGAFCANTGGYADPTIYHMRKARQELGKKAVAATAEAIAATLKSGIRMPIACDIWTKPKMSKGLLAFETYRIVSEDGTWKMTPIYLAALPFSKVCLITIRRSFIVSLIYFMLSIGTRP
eukprot:GHVU01182301.1.p2 GENE.GHVU01182301.1~~GHVU01182301.1.p2  ORF type:complete len:143 (-),score=4.90 GHVU01182301.1:47-475(-)